MMLQAVYKLSLRSTEGFLNSLFNLMNVPLKSPDYSSVSKRARTVKVKIPRPSGPVAHVVFDATGLKRISSTQLTKELRRKPLMARPSGFEPLTSASGGQSRVRW